MTEATLTPNGLIINGANFGNTNPMLFWDDVQSHIHLPSQIDIPAPAGPLAIWRENGTPWNTPMDYKQRVTRSGETSVVYTGTPSSKHIGSPSHRTIAGQENKLYVSWWYKPSQDPGSEGGANKFIRVWDDGSGYGTRISWTHMHIGCTINEEPLVHWGSWNGTIGVWNHHELTVDFTRNQVQARVNGVLLHTIDCTKKLGYEKSPLYVQVLGFDHGNSDYQSMVTELDDIYISGNPARVELSNSATWSASMLKEVLPIRDWRNNRIVTGTVNGIIDPDSAMYLYVVDAEGYANPNGVLVKCTNLNVGHCQWLPPKTTAVPNDFNGDGKSDLLFQNASGTRVWYMDGATTLDNQALWPASDWKVIGTGDFNGDHKADLLLRKTANTILGVWLNGTPTSPPRPIWSDSAWHVAGIGDFNGDGSSDILQRKNGATATRVVLQNVASPLVGSNVLTLAMPNWDSTAWEIAGVGDFDGDGKSDLFMRNGNETRIWLNDKPDPNNFARLPFDLTREIIAFADFNGDGKTDLLHRLVGGTGNLIWILDSGQKQAEARIDIDSNWLVTGAGDFDGDGRADVLQRRKDRAQTQIWSRKATVELSSVSIASNWLSAPTVLSTDYTAPSVPANFAGIVGTGLPA